MCAQSPHAGDAPNPQTTDTGNAQTLGGSPSIAGFLAGARYAADLLSRTLTTPDSRSKRSTPKEIATGEVGRNRLTLDLLEYHIGQLACARAHSTAES